MYVCLYVREQKASVVPNKSKLVHMYVSNDRHIGIGKEEEKEYLNLFD